MWACGGAAPIAAAGTGWIHLLQTTLSSRTGRQGSPTTVGSRPTKRAVPRCGRMATSASPYSWATCPAIAPCLTFASARLGPMCQVGWSNRAPGSAWQALAYMRLWDGDWCSPKCTAPVQHADHRLTSRFQSCPQAAPSLMAPSSAATSAVMGVFIKLRAAASADTPAQPLWHWTKLSSQSTRLMCAPCGTSALTGSPCPCRQVGGVKAWMQVWYQTDSMRMPCSICRKLAEMLPLPTPLVCSLHVCSGGAT